jgi:hypothetical protein
MDTKPLKKDDVFTVEQANAMLPLVRAITTDLVARFQEVADRRQRLRRLVAGRDLESGDPYTSELVQIQEELNKEVGELEGYMDELRQLGVELKSPSEGLVDFPARLDGRPVYLCWQLGEPEVMYWHPRDGGFAGRKPLPAVVAADSMEAEI